MPQFYLLSLKHTRPSDNVFTWWGPDSRDYTWDLDKAGLYEESEAREIEAGGDIHDTIAVPVEAARCASWRTVEFCTDTMVKMGVNDQWCQRMRKQAEREKQWRRERQLEARDAYGRFQRVDSFHP